MTLLTPEEMGSIGWTGPVSSYAMARAQLRKVIAEIEVVVRASEDNESVAEDVVDWLEAVKKEIE